MYNTLKLFEMDTPKWFDRKFDFNLAASDYLEIRHRLHLTDKKLSYLVDVSEDCLNEKPDTKWSVKEHVGHLCILEPLWRQRIIDINNCISTLTPADLENRATTEGNFNLKDISLLLQLFKLERTATLSLLDGMNDIVSNTSLHPRLHKPMRIIDHLYFVAEHDAHHMDIIKQML